jgi:hypothetical protein
MGPVSRTVHVRSAGRFLAPSRGMLRGTSRAYTTFFFSSA